MHTAWAPQKIIMPLQCRRKLGFTAENTLVREGCRNVYNESNCEKVVDTVFSRD